MSKRTDSPGLGSLGSGAVTAISLLLTAGVAAAIGVVIAREFGRSDETDGLLAAYGVFVVIAIAAQAIRIAVLPQLARARAERRLAGEVAGSALAVSVLAVPLLLVAVFGVDALAGLLTGESEVAKETAADALRWLVPAAVAQLFAALAASTLAALDDYVTAAVGYAAGSATGLALILLRVEPDGIVAIAWGMALNAGIALAVPSLALAVRAVRLRMPTTAVLPTGPPLPARVGAFAVGAAVPLAQQLLYLVCLPFAARLGTGAATSFVYAYLAATSVVAVTAGSLGLVTSVPLSRAGVSPTETARHVSATSWIALAFAGVTAGVFALAGGDLVAAVLGGAYGAEIGAELGRLIVVLSLWMLASIGVTVTFPLAFVARRTERLPWIAAAALAVQLPLAWLGARALELEGLALALGLATLVILAGLLRELGALAETARELGRAALVVGGLTVAAFVPPALVLGPVASAVVGAVVYGALLAALRPRGLLAGWRYLRALA